MATQVIKGDGCQIAFDAARIEAAIRAAAKAAQIDDDNYCTHVASQVSARLSNCQQVESAAVQRAVENLLMSGRYPQPARCYSEYRHERDVARERQGQLDHAIRGLVEQSQPALVKQNAKAASSPAQVRGSPVLSALTMTPAVFQSFAACVAILAAPMHVGLTLVSSRRCNGG